MDSGKILDLMGKMYEMLDETNKEVKKVKKTVVRMENDNKEKFGALFDGYKLSSEKLDRIETEQIEHGVKLEIIERVVTQHDAVIKSVK